MGFKAGFSCEEGKENSKEFSKKSIRDLYDTWDWLILWDTIPVVEIECRN